MGEHAMATICALLSLSIEEALAGEDGDGAGSSARLDEIWESFGPLSERQAAWLAAAGIGADALARAGSLRVGTLMEGDLGWDYRGPDLLVVVQRVLTFRADEPALAAVAEDLLAWSPREPGRWWLWQDAADWLGGWVVSAAVEDGGSLALNATPFDWLRAGCEGAVLLRPCIGLPCGGRESEDRFLRTLLMGAGSVVCPPGFGEAVFDALRKRPAERIALPEVLEREEEEVAA